MLKNTLELSPCLSPADWIRLLNDEITSDMGTLTDPRWRNHSTTSSRVMIPSNGSISGPGVGVVEDDFFFFREVVVSDPVTDGVGDPLRL